MRISIVAAMDEKRGVGKNNDLLFRISEDFKRMKALTLNHPIIMGRKTFESIGRVLPQRTNIIISRDPDYYVDGAIVVDSLEKAIAKAKEKELERHSGERSDSRIDPGQVEDPGRARSQTLTSIRLHEMTEPEVFVFGGGQIWKEAMKKGLVDRLYLTLVKGDYNADTFFPDYSKFTKVLKKESGESDGHSYTFLDLEKQ